MIKMTQRRTKVLIWLSEKVFLKPETSSKKKPHEINIFFKKTFNDIWSVNNPIQIVAFFKYAVIL